MTLLAPRWPKMRFGEHLGLHLDGYWGASWRQDGAKLANLVPRCAQDAKMANLAHLWEHLGDLFWILGAILPKMAKIRKTQ